MKKSIYAAFVLVALIVFTPMTRAQEIPDSLFDEMRAQYEATTDAKVKLDICRQGLMQFPESKYTMFLLNLAKDNSAELNQMEEFISLAENVRSQVESQDMQKSINRLLVETFGEMGDVPRLDALSKQRIENEEENYNLFYDLVRAYTDTEQWTTVLTYAGRAEPFANAESYKKDYPDRLMSDEDFAESGRNRKGLLLTYTGWAKANGGQTKAALNDYKTAEKLARRAYLGYSEAKLDYFWGKTLIESGQIDQAMNRLSAKALFDEDEASLEALKEAYIEKNGGEAECEKFLEKQRLKFAREIDDFTLDKYDGEKLTLSSFKGKVILISFWFPT